MSQPTQSPRARILRVSIPASLVDELDELDLDALEIGDNPRFLRLSRDRKWLVSPPFVDDEVGRDVVAYCRDVAGGTAQITDLTCDYVFVRTSAPGALDGPSTVPIDGVELKEGWRLVAIRRDGFHAQEAGYRRRGYVIKEEAPSAPA